MKKWTRRELDDAVTGLFLARRIPEAFQFAMPGQFARLNRIARTGEIRLSTSAGQGQQTLTMSPKKWGGSARCEALLKHLAMRCGLVLSSGERRSKVGVLTSANTSGVAGIGFFWYGRRNGSGTPTLHVRASHPTKAGKAIGRSVDLHGLDRALDAAIEARLNWGAPQPNREVLMRRLQAEYQTRGQQGG